MATQEAPPAHARQLHYGQVVWEDEAADRYWMPGHVEVRRAISAANRYAREECGLENLADDPEVRLSWVKVRHLWCRESSEWPVEWERCEATSPRAEPFTAVDI